MYINTFTARTKVSEEERELVFASGPPNFGEAGMGFRGSVEALRYVAAIGRVGRFRKGAKSHARYAWSVAINAMVAPMWLIS